MIQLILHLIGDYITQSHWMAENKTKRSWPAMVHAIVYSLPFLLLKPSLSAFAVILGTHFLIDRFRLARCVVWGKNRIFGARPPYPTGSDDLEGISNYDDHDRKWSWSNCSATGYPSEVPAWLSVWLLIIADNTLHLTINYLALRFL